MSCFLPVWVLNQTDGLSGSRGLVGAHNDADGLAIVSQSNADLLFAAERCQKVLVLVAVGVGELAGVTAACR